MSIGGQAVPVQSILSALGNLAGRAAAKPRRRRHYPGYFYAADGELAIDPADPSNVPWRCSSSTRKRIAVESEGLESTRATSPTNRRSDLSPTTNALYRRRRRLRRMAAGQRGSVAETRGESHAESSHPRRRTANSSDAGTADSDGMLDDLRAPESEPAWLPQMIAAQRQQAANHQPSPNGDHPRLLQFDELVEELALSEARRQARRIAQRCRGSSTRRRDCWRSGLRFGACGLCWGDDDTCRSCRGRGKPAASHPTRRCGCVLRRAPAMPAASGSSTPPVKARENSLPAIPVRTG